MSFGPQRTRLIYAITLEKIAGGSPIKVPVPPNASISWVKFSDDGSRLSFINTTSDDTELWVANVSSGSARMAADRCCSA